MKSKESILIVIPSYNEKENIENLINEILKQNNKIDLLVVDDNSPDGTSEIVSKHKKLNKRVFLITRNKKDGRGGAVLDGFQFGLKSNKKYEYFFEMDADFSHAPNEIGDLLEKIDQYDMVIGSRYLRKSKIVGWPINRRIFSKLANIYARVLLRIPISDYTNGYRLYRKEVLERLNFKAIKKSGYIVLSEVAFQVHLAGFRIGEVPTLFVNRQRGISNLTLSEVLSAFHSVLRLAVRRKKIKKALERK
jgi:dolichol-phosphate mannosyltransferase